MSIPRMNSTGYDESAGRDMEEIKEELATQGIKWGRDKVNRKLHPEITGRLPICPYGCGREGTLLEIVMTEGGQAIGIFNDHPCGCVFYADIEIGEPPTKRKLVIGSDGEYHEEGESDAQTA
jgi:hypothetical protein